MYCPKCGKDVEDSKFCPECGTAVSETVVVPVIVIYLTFFNNELHVPSW